MENLDYWRFCNELTVIQAALLILNLDPTPLYAYIDGKRPEELPPGYVAVVTALQNDVLSGRLKATVQRFCQDRGDDSDDVNWDRTRITVNDLKEWLSERGVTSGFFFPEGPVAADYLDRKHPNFSLKLAAAVEAWRAVKAERAAKTSGRTVKADLTRWLNLHAARYGLTNDKGEPNKQAIEEVAKVANWDKKGGAPKTPGNQPTH